MVKTHEEAYQNYLEECEEEIKLPGITVNKIEESGYRILKDIIVAELVNAPDEPIVRKLLKANDYLEELRKENKR
ncbi:hypothetical protein K144316041_23860 [Clostridium tetani]|uniref:hypothetical protein n=1 Tax=Clostridium tetani TaxID=1513 RepID=UPI002953D94F|nr:hypothetical protein [Clostridium tetani]BDR73375.1 hypothetical protein K144316041_20830 [Clostridium tetani]BDR73678.1 hypothetical protein K144316041_23860 [Clostridium tetani]